jgi:hypothetical protein
MKKRSAIDPDCDYLSIPSTTIDKIIWMWQGGVSIMAIANYFRSEYDFEVEDINNIIDAYQEAYV